jgi:hypothetical protein
VGSSDPHAFFTNILLMPVYRRDVTAARYARSPNVSSLL